MLLPPMGDRTTDQAAPGLDAADEAPVLLLVDDNAANLQVLYGVLAREGYQLLMARSGADALRIAGLRQPLLILLDVMMPEMDGYEACRRLKADPATRDAVVIFLSALTESEEKVRGLEAGAVDFISKPIRADEVRARVRAHVRLKRLERQLRERNASLERELRVATALVNEAHRPHLGMLVGESEAVRGLRAAILETAGAERDVIVYGPAGSEREGVARAIHRRSARAGRPFLSCSAQTAELSEVARLLGLAADGTLYLGPVDRLSQARQQALLELLGPEGPPARARLIGAASDSPANVPPWGKLRGPLFAALRAGGVVVPSLAARREDIGALADFFLDESARRFDRSANQLSPASRGALEAYHWPGNLSELRSVIEQAVALASGELIEVEDRLLMGGRRMGGYRLLEPLGEGGMGSVWKAEHNLLARPAAVKLIRASGEGSDLGRLRERFLEEARATAALSSPHTVQLYDFGVTEGDCFLVMELLTGMSLEAVIERAGPLPPARARRFLQQACVALAEAHQAGLVHRDIKPSNLFISKLGVQRDMLKVLDFGAVTVAGGTGQAALGTPIYMPPEALFGDPVDPRADIYALGCVGYEMLTGASPFPARTLAELLVTKRRAQVEPPPCQVPAFGALLVRCLARDRDQRPGDVLELWDGLRALQLPDRWGHREARAWWDAADDDAQAGVIGSK